MLREASAFVNARNLNSIQSQSIQPGRGRRRVVLASWTTPHHRVLAMSIERPYTYYRRDSERLSVSRAIHPICDDTLTPSISHEDGITRRFWGEHPSEIGVHNYADRFTDIFDCLTPDMVCERFTINSATPLMVLCYSHKTDRSYY